MRIDQALDFIHACPPGKFESLSDLLSPELVQACLAETGSVSLRRRRMPMERVLWAIIGMSLFRHVPMAQLANQLDILLPGDRPFVVPSAFIQARQNWLTKPFDRCSSRPPHSGISSVSTPPGPACSCWPWTGWSGARPILRTMPAPLPSRKPSRGDAISPGPHVVSDGADQSSADPDSDGLLCGKRDGVGRATD